MTLVADVFTIVAVAAGTCFLLAGTVGLLRFPDAISRLHALTKADSLGLGLIALGLLPRAHSVLGAAKLVLVAGLVMFAGAVVAQLIAQLARNPGRSR
jgi:multicomponent Na+:H+ antiporter subunit G